jgi:hypothetical protein
MFAMKVVRLPSGPLACVYSLDEGAHEREIAPPHSSGTFRAHSGSLHADGVSEDEALAVLDQHVRRITIPPSDDMPSDSYPNPAPTESLWAARVRKCGASSTPSAEPETPFDGITIPPPFSTAPPKVGER